MLRESRLRGDGSMSSSAMSWIGNGCSLFAGAFVEGRPFFALLVLALMCGLLVGSRRHRAASPAGRRGADGDSSSRAHASFPGARYSFQRLVLRRTVRGAGFIGAQAWSRLGAVRPRAAGPLCPVVRRTARRRRLHRRAGVVPPRGHWPTGGRTALLGRQADRAPAPASSARRRGPASGPFTDERPDRPIRSSGGPRAGAGLIGAQAWSRLGAVHRRAPRHRAARSSGGPRAGASFIGAQAWSCLGAVSDEPGPPHSVVR